MLTAGLAAADPHNLRASDVAGPRRPQQRLAIRM